MFICLYKQQLLLAKINHVICYSQSQLLLAKSNESSNYKLKDSIGPIMKTSRTPLQYGTEAFKDDSPLIKIRKLETTLREISVAVLSWHSCMGSAVEFPLKQPRHHCNMLPKV